MGSKKAKEIERDIIETIEYVSEKVKRIPEASRKRVIRIMGREDVEGYRAIL